MLTFPEIKIPIIEILTPKNIKLSIKREDLVHSEISGNKYWKLFYNVNLNIEKKTEIITFGGAFSNHILAVSALGKELKIKTIGIIRGEEISKKWKDNFTLKCASENGMEFYFVSREEYRNKEKLTEYFENKFPKALIIPEGGTNELAAEGIKHILNQQTKDFDYLCSAVGTGGTIAGISKYCDDNQKVIGFKVVNDSSLENIILKISGRKNFRLIDAHDGSYGKITDENIDFVNDFYHKYKIPLDPIYTGKMMKKIFELIDNDFFPYNSKILAFHTGGLQGVKGANEILKKQNRMTISFA